MTNSLDSCFFIFKSTVMMVYVEGGGARDLPMFRQVLEGLRAISAKNTTVDG